MKKCHFTSLKIILIFSIVFLHQEAYSGPGPDGKPHEFQVPVPYAPFASRFWCDDPSSEGAPSCLRVKQGVPPGCILNPETGFVESAVDARIWFTTGHCVVFDYLSPEDEKNKLKTSFSTFRVELSQKSASVL